MYFIRQLLQGQWARTQANLQNECMVKTDQSARIRRLMSISTSFLRITCIGFMYIKVIMIMSSSSRSNRHNQHSNISSNSNNSSSCSRSSSSCCNSSSSSSSGGGSSNF